MITIMPTERMIDFEEDFYGRPLSGLDRKCEFQREAGDGVPWEPVNSPGQRSGTSRCQSQMTVWKMNLNWGSGGTVLEEWEQ